jgi:hypothetical protein
MRVESPEAFCHRGETEAGSCYRTCPDLLEVRFTLGSGDRRESGKPAAPRNGVPTDRSDGSNDRQAPRPKVDWLALAVDHTAVNCRKIGLFVRRAATDDGIPGGIVFW